MLRVKSVLCVAPQTEQGKAMELVKQASKLLMAVWGGLICSFAFSAFLGLQLNP